MPEQQGKKADAMTELRAIKLDPGPRTRRRTEAPQAPVRHSYAGTRVDLVCVRYRLATQVIIDRMFCTTLVLSGSTSVPPMRAVAATT